MLAIGAAVLVVLVAACISDRAVPVQPQIPDAAGTLVRVAVEEGLRTVEFADGTEAVLPSGMGFMCKDATWVTPKGRKAHCYAQLGFADDGRTVAWMISERYVPDVGDGLPTIISGYIHEIGDTWVVFGNGDVARHPNASIDVTCYGKVGRTWTTLEDLQDAEAFIAISVEPHTGTIAKASCIGVE